MSASFELPARHGITGVILAGGLSRRMRLDGQTRDKGLIGFRGQPMITHAIARISAQVDALLINANRHLAEYAGFGMPVVPDRISGFVGPLAGLQAAMACAGTPWVLTAPCDAPFLPSDLAARLRDTALAAGLPIAVARTDGREQPVFLLARSELRPALERYLLAGESKVDRWYQAQGVAVVEFPDSSGFRNINTTDDIARFQHD